MADAQDTKDKFSYFINLSKRQIILVGLGVFLGIFLIFFSGFTLGFISSNNKKTEADIVPTIGTIKSLDIANGRNGESEIVFDDTLSSSELLKKDNPQSLNSVARKKSAKKSTSSTSLSKKVNSSIVYYLQIIATNSEEKANNILKDFKKRNYQGLITKAENNGKNIYVIRIGPYENKERALRHLSVIREKSPYKQAFIKKYKRS